MNGATEPLSSTAPVRAWYLVRQCLGTIPISEWAEATELGGSLRGDLLGSGLHPVFRTRSAERLVWCSDGAKEASSAHDAVTGFFRVDESVNAQTASSALGLRNQLKGRISDSFNRLYKLAEEEWFEDGLQSNLSLGLEVLFRHYPAQTMTELSKLLKKGSIKQGALVETLKVLGRVESPETRELRLYNILDFLGHSSLVIRDAALVGLCLLNEKRALAYLERAAAREDNPFFRGELEEVMKQLRA